MGVEISEGKVRSLESKDSIENVCFSRGVFTSSFVQSHLPHFPQFTTKEFVTSLDLSAYFEKDVAEQVLCFVKSRTVTGSNAVIDAGWSL